MIYDKNRADPSRSNISFILVPCQLVVYKSGVQEYEENSGASVMHEPGSRQIYFYYGTTDTVVMKQIPVISGNDMIGALGGSLGLFLGFSFCGTVFDTLNLVCMMLKKIKNTN